MSRVGRMPISIPDGVTVNIEDNTVSAEGPKGKLSVQIDPEMSLNIEDGLINVTRPSDSKIHRSIHGLSRSLIANIVHGVTHGYEKRLEIIGVGYRAELKGKKLLFSLGYSHQILFVPPEEIELSMEEKSNNIIIIRGIQKELVGLVAAKIRSFRKPEPYKGKGIRYFGELVRKKAGKTAA